MNPKKHYDGFVLNSSVELQLDYRCRLKGKPPIHFNLSELDPTGELAQLLTDLFRSPTPSETVGNLSLKNFGRLIQLGILVPKDQNPQQIVFECPLSSKVVQLIPESHLSIFDEPRRDGFQPNPTLYIQMNIRAAGSSLRLPPENDFPIQGPLIWVTDTETEMAWPYWCDGDTLELIRGLQSGKIGVNELSSEQFGLFVLSNILISPDSASLLHQNWQRQLVCANETLVNDGYAILRGLVPPLYVAALRAYLRALESEGFLDFSERKVNFGRFVKHNDPVAKFIHRQSGNFMRKLTGELIIPSYTLLSAYVPGADLARHTDRPQCRWNASLLIDMNPETAVEESWPLRIENEGKVKEIRLGMGDCAVYRGSELPHSREPLAFDRRQTLILFHYVPIDFTGTLH